MLQTNEHYFVFDKPTSSFGFQATLKLEWDTSRNYEGFTEQSITHYVYEMLPTALNSSVVAEESPDLIISIVHDNDTSSHKLLRSFLKVFKRLLKKYATYQAYAWQAKRSRHASMQAVGHSKPSPHAISQNYLITVYRQHICKGMRGRGPLPRDPLLTPSSKVSTDLSAVVLVAIIHRTHMRIQPILRSKGSTCCSFEKPLATPESVSRGTIMRASRSIKPLEIVAIRRTELIRIQYRGAQDVELGRQRYSKWILCRRNTTFIRSTSCSSLTLLLVNRQMFCHFLRLLRPTTLPC